MRAFITRWCACIGGSGANRGAVYPKWGGWAPSARELGLAEEDLTRAIQDWERLRKLRPERAAQLERKISKAREKMARLREEF